MSFLPSLKYYLIEKYARIMIRRLAEILHLKPTDTKNEN